MKQRSDFFIICLLGALSVVSPFAIDMYLPAYLKLAADLSVSSSVIALTISAYFIGLAGGQLFYGPLLDRFGRKPPLYAGLSLFIIASLGCALSGNIYILVALRFVQGLGGCVAQVASLAMVRDFFAAEKSARILSRLFLFIAASPLLAPSIGGFLAATCGWRAVFIVLMVIVLAIVALMYFLMPEGHIPDKSISLKLGPIVREYRAILKVPSFTTYAVAGAFSFAGLFTYVAGSPIIFMEGFHLSPQVYSAIFAFLAVGFIGCSQLNVLFLRKYTSAQVFFLTLVIQVITTLVFVLGVAQGWYGLGATLALFFVTLSCAGLTYPNAAAMAMTPFTRNVGSASALLGFLQLGIGAVISSGISLSKTSGSLPIIAILAVTSSLGLIVLLWGRKKIARAPLNDPAIL